MAELFIILIKKKSKGGNQMASRTGSLRELRALLHSKGYLNKQRGYYTLEIIGTLCILGLSVVLVTAIDNWFVLLSAILFAFAYVRIALLGHDFGHRAVFDSEWKNWAGALVISFLLGIDPSWWTDKHDKHHTNPNQPGKDPDEELPIFAFNIEQAINKRFPSMVKIQEWLWYPFLCLEGINLRYAGIRYLFQAWGTKKFSAIEALLMSAHIAVYLFLLWWFLSPVQAILFFVAHQFLFGFWMSTLFAPNHKSMPRVGENYSTDFLMQQALPTQNVKPWPFMGWWWGGLDDQQTHHFFPNMTRYNLKKARPIVVKYCRDHGIPYVEAGVFASQLAVWQNLRNVARQLRMGLTTA